MQVKKRSIAFNPKSTILSDKPRMYKLGLMESPMKIINLLQRNVLKTYFWLILLSNDCDKIRISAIINFKIRASMKKLIPYVWHYLYINIFIIKLSRFNVVKVFYTKIKDILMMSHRTYFIIVNWMQRFKILN